MSFLYKRSHKNISHVICKFVHEHDVRSSNSSSVVLHIAACWSKENAKCGTVPHGTGRGVNCSFIPSPFQCYDGHLTAIQLSSQWDCFTIYCCQIMTDIVSCYVNIAECPVSVNPVSTLCCSSSLCEMQIRAGLCVIHFQHQLIVLTDIPNECRLSVT